tara:strand:+ start:208 stop:525 length:318 start_codon:yes stop_codon:yes gene_type:complete
MALTESIEYDKIEVVGIYKHVQVRKANVIKKDGAELTRSFERYTLNCGALKGGFKEDGTTPADDANDFVATDISSEPSEVSDICNLVWTQSVKDAWKAKLIADIS